MGYGDYSHEAHEAITTARAEAPRQEVFKQRTIHPLMDPKGVRVRESRDSAAHPNSLAIVFALDVTGSMGMIPDLLARRELPKFMKALGTLGVADPQVLFLAVGDVVSDVAPLQVGQFETTGELMDQWLVGSFLEGGGGPFGRESYELALYFLAEHAAADCWEKRKNRGYVFLTGDEEPYPAVSRAGVERVLGDRLDEDVPTDAVVAAVQEAWEPFFLIPDLARRAHCEAAWRKLLGDRVICMESPDDTVFVAAGIVALGEGFVKDLDGLAKAVAAAGAPADRVAAVVRALTPYAGTLQRDGAPAPATEPVETGGLWNKLFGE